MLKVRKIAVQCSYPNCKRFTRRHNRLCVRHRNNEPLVLRYKLKEDIFNKWKNMVENEKYGNIRTEWELI